MDWKKAVTPAREVQDFAKSAGSQAKSASQVVADAIDKQIELFKKPKDEGRRWFEIKGDKVGFSIRYANSPLKLVEEERVVVVSKAQFVEVLEAIKVDVLAGAFKDQLDAAEANVRKRSAKMAESRKRKKA